MNINSWLARGVASVAVISCALGASACSPQHTSAALPSPTAKITQPSSGSVLNRPDRWTALASNTPATMAEVQGKTFGLSNWKVGKAQGYFGVALMDNCVVALSPFATSGYNVMVETRSGEPVANQNVQSVDKIQQIINDSRDSCG